MLSCSTWWLKLVRVTICFLSHPSVVETRRGRRTEFIGWPQNIQWQMGSIELCQLEESADTFDDIFYPLTLRDPQTHRRVSIDILVIYPTGKETPILLMSSVVYSRSLKTNKNGWIIWNSWHWSHTVFDWWIFLWHEPIILEHNMVENVPIKWLFAKDQKVTWFSRIWWTYNDTFVLHMTPLPTSCVCVPVFPIVNVH